MEWTQILGAAFGVMVLFYLWPAYKHWSQNSPKAEKGDWMAVAIPIGAIALLILILIKSVQS